MDAGWGSAVLLPIGLGLLGFVEPCTIGAHLVFIRTLADRPGPRRAGATLAFIAARVLTTGSLGGAAAALGQQLIAAQTALWLAFGGVYMTIGLIYLSGRSNRLAVALSLAPSSLKASRHPIVLGVVFGLNIPACAAPILFVLIGLAATTGSVVSGFGAMALFGLALSSPLLIVACRPGLANAIEAMMRRNGRGRLILGLVFLGLGLWSIWFGLFVDPKDWASL